ncbi:alpha/beta fold hydrolase [Rhodanobacter sp. PCA2]|uniref:alpha/beta fold hydrolase n=1 Tax=Rhodanobacter sp. PCA2 TaxID=2006117 RepID=UPI002106B56E|nr:alpha/beta fold hydrolase [Rhodanobacter sp. PCA2]
MMPERAFRFGRAGHLVGMVGLPTGAHGAVGVIVLNTGLMHRVGPFRLHVDMTRRLNALGYPTLRFDLSTMGDSGASAEAASREQQVRADVGDAVALLRAQTGCTRFVLVGLCRGAQSAHAAACTEPAVAGAIFLDGYIYRTTGFKLRHYLPRLLSPARWHGFFARKLRQAVAPEEVTFGSVYPPKEQVRGELAAMLARGLKLYFVYSGGIGEQFNHPRQFRECYGREVADHPALRMDLLDGTDHTYTLVCDRERMFGHVERWLKEQFPPPAPRVAAG